MTHGSGYFGFESIVYAVLTVLAIATLSMFANASLHISVVA